MPRGLLFGRRIRVTVGAIVVTDIVFDEPEASARRSLDVAFTTEAHTKLEPLQTQVTLVGLNRHIRAALAAQQKRAASEAWEKYQAVVTGAIAVTEEEEVFQTQQQLTFRGIQVKIEAGYQDDFGVLADTQALPNGIEPNATPAEQPTTIIKAQDSRYPWQNGFVSEEVAPGVSYRLYEDILEASEGYLNGTISAEAINEKYPELLQRKNFAGYLNGRVLAGDTATLQDELAQTLGLKRFYDRGQTVWLDMDAVTQDEAVVLQLSDKRRSNAATPGGLLTHTTPDNRGFVEAHCLLNHRLTPGRQVFLRDEQGKEIGEGVFRVEHVKHTGTNYGPAFYSDVLLRPTKTPYATNV